MAEITANDFFDFEGSISGLQSINEGLLQIIKTGKSMSQSIKGADNIRAIKDETEKLTISQVELQKIEKQITTAQARNNEEYIKAKKNLTDLNTTLKQRTALGDKDARQVRATNASLKELQAALQKNKDAYKSLATEEDRASKEGAELLHIIQLQDKEFKDLNKTLGEHQANVGNYPGQLDKANAAAGALTPGLHGMANGLLTATKAAIAFIATPLGAVLAAIALVLAPIVSFLKNTGDGMDLVEKKTSGLKNGLAFLRDEFSELGRNILDSDTNVGKFAASLLKSNPIVLAVVAQINLLKKAFPGLSAAYDEAVEAGERYAEMMDMVQTRQKFQEVEFAKEENAIKRLILQSKNRTLTEEQRIALIDQALKKEEDMTARRVKNAEDELTAAYRLAKSRTTLTQAELANFDTQEKAAVAMAEAFDKADESLRDQLLNAIVKLEQARGESIAIEEKLQNQRDALLDKAAERDAKRAEEELKRQQQIAEARRKLLEDANKDAQKAGKEISDSLEKPGKVATDTFGKIETGIQHVTDTARFKFNQMVESLKNSLELARGIWADFSNNVGALIDSLTERRLQKIDQEERRLDEQTAKRITAAGDNEAAIARIEAEAELKRQALEKKRIQAQRKAAIFDKATAITMSLINTALGISKTIGQLGFPAAIPFIALTAALGAVQTAAIIAKPIPQYFKGTKSAEGGPAWVGERGVEAMRKPGQDWELTPSHATLMNVPRGTEIVPHAETMRRLAIGALGQNGGSVQQVNHDPELLNEMKSLNRNISKIKPVQQSLVRSGMTVYSAIKDAEGHTKLVKGINMGRWF